MRLLLREKSTQLYFQGPDKWTKEPARAFDFRFMDRAVQYCEIWGLKGMELAFFYDMPEQVITVPLEGAARQVAVVA